MAFIEGTNRAQLQFADFFDFESLISKDNPVRAIDAFVNTLNLKELGFVCYSGNSKGQKPYHTEMLVKLHIYGYINSIRSSRKQERECYRNIEVMWLTNNLKPDHSTIANFCKDNAKVLKKLLNEFNLICDSLGLFGYDLEVFDGTKIKALCSKKNAFTIKKLEKNIENIDKKIQEYIDSISSDNEQEQTIDIDKFNTKINELYQRKEDYSNLKQHMVDNNISEICLTDTEAKVMKNHSNIEPCYNAQTVVDSKNSLIITTSISNQANDIGLLKPMHNELLNTPCFKNFLHNNSDHHFFQTADAGYYKTNDLLDLNNSLVTTLVPKPDTTSISGSKQFSKDKFIYDIDKDVYICPAQKILPFYQLSKEKRNNITTQYKIYRCSACSTCPYSSECTSAVEGRTIKRHPNESSLIELDNLYKRNKDLYKKRKEVVEHPFGCIKRHIRFILFYSQI